MRLSRYNPNRKKSFGGLRCQRGYMLLILMFFVALITFSLMAILPKVIQQVKRDKEEEMIHRGTEYERAVKKFYKKFGRYPNTLKDLETTNNIRFIRRLYKDPMSKDGNWRLLHITDVQQGISNPNFGVSQANNFNPTQGGAVQILGGAAGAQAGATGSAPGQNQGLALSPSSPSDSGEGENILSPSTPALPSGAGPQSAGPQTNLLSSSPGQMGQPGQTAGGSTGIVGVASLNKSKSIREFGGKSNYYKWMFIYDPTQDKGTLLKGPYNPQAFQGGATNGATGTQGQPGAPGSSPFGPSSGQQQPQQPQQPQQNGPGGNMPPDQNAPPE